jgi:hypothetical protein
MLPKSLYPHTLAGLEPANIGFTKAVIRYISQRKAFVHVDIKTCTVSSLYINKFLMSVC